MIPNKIIVYFSKTRIDDYRMNQILISHPFLRKYYHYVIRPDGTLEKGIDTDKQGKIRYGNDQDAILISIVGGRDSDGNLTDTRTPQQKETLYNLLSRLILIFDIAPTEINVGSEYDNSLDLLYELERWLMADVIQK